MRTSLGASASLARWPLVVSASAAAAVVLPFAIIGVPSGHDIEFHLFSWLEVANQWKHAIVYPRWAQLANVGYGEPRFIFYPPASCTWGALLTTLLPWKSVPAAYCFVVLMTAGVAMYICARHLLVCSETRGLLAAGLYVASPYNFIVVYWRSAYAELMTIALFPLALLLAFKMAASRRTALAPLAIAIAATWLTDLPAALLVSYTLLLIALVIATSQRSLAPVIDTIAALALGLALIGFFILPAAYEQRWVTIAQALDKPLLPENNFLFRGDDPFGRLLSVVGAVEFAFLGVTLVLARDLRRNRPLVFWALAVTAAAVGFAMLPVSALFWRILPELAFVQFPWRLLLVLNAIAVITAVGFRRVVIPAVAFVVCIGMLLAIAFRSVPIARLDAEDLAATRSAVSTGAGYQGAWEYAPRDASIETLQNAPRSFLVSASSLDDAEREIKAEVNKLTLTPEKISMQVEVAEKARLTLHLLNYPAWQASVNGKPGVPQTDETGRLTVDVPAGRDALELQFTRTMDRTAGTAVTIVALVVLIVIFRASVPGGRGRRGVLESDTASANVL